jgi:hypothetical protein
MRAAYEASCVENFNEKPTESEWLLVVTAYRNNRYFCGWTGELNAARIAIVAAIGVLFDDAMAIGRPDVALILAAYGREAASYV